VLVAGGAAVLALNLLVWGCHAYLPWRLAAGEDRLRRAWAAAALPALGLSAIATFAVLRAGPDPAVVWGLTGFASGSPAARWIAVATAALALSDLVLFLGGARLGAREWRLAGVFGVLGLASQTWGSELLRIGWGPVPGPFGLLLGTLLRLPLALAAAELVAGGPRRWTTAAGPALAAAWLFWPGALRRAMALDLLTLAAALALLLAARHVPASLRRATGAAGLALAVLFLARSAVVSAILGGGDVLPIEFLAP
jgi:hypothetical protein